MHPVPLMLRVISPLPPDVHPSSAAAAPARPGGGTRLRDRVVDRLGLARHWQWWLIASMLLVVLLAVLREPIGGLLWPETRSEALRAEAERALAEGRLSAADGSGARELFEAALAMDPDRREASRGLAQVAAAALVQALVALARIAGRRPRRLALARRSRCPRPRPRRWKTRCGAARPSADSMNCWRRRRPRASADTSTRLQRR